MGFNPRFTKMGSQGQGYDCAMAKIENFGKLFFK